MNYTDAINDITTQGKFRICLGLERIYQLLDLLGNPQDRLKCIQVAGTNGKGSVCTMLSAILQEAGYKTGLYTSPHIFEYTERIKINGDDITKEDFGSYYTEIIKISEENNINPTEFEILTAIMFKYFADNNIDIAIIETGLGGRFDATNVLKTNLCAIITHIDLDHTDRLGNTKDEIAVEKAGIIKPNSIIITSEGYEGIKDRADEVNALFTLTSPFVEQEYIDALPLKGEHQRENLALALTAMNYLFRDITESTIISGLKKVKNPCRFQYIKEKNLIVDGAHNPNCFQALSENLDRYFQNEKRNYIFGCLNTKDYKKMLSYITNDLNKNELYVYKFNNPNSVCYETINDFVPCKKLENISDVINKEDLTVVCGSFYMINELIPKEWIYQTRKNHQ